ncbi:butyrophilin subfamily 1 member A1-like [Mauremys reevesii]|uniref:butyrophilin subfamily 1 member A1-like n=1 Tax=Mauremys reevesii TaxID=260615 RepID=UPI00193EF48A|nr:butyrophilin subfamily 1 member A1-like [Mauremys reevesii]
MEGPRVDESQSQGKLQKEKGPRVDESQSQGSNKEKKGPRVDESQSQGKLQKEKGPRVDESQSQDELVTQIDELQIEVERLQKENNELKVELDELKVELDWTWTLIHSDKITINPDTAHPNLSISEDKKKFTHEPQPQKVPSSPERFDSTVCVLGSEGFSFGKQCWEVDVRSSTDWDLGVARKATERKGKLSLSPKEGFWVLGLSGRDYWAKTDPWTQVLVQKKPLKIGVYLNYQEGQVTFFNVTDMSVLFTFNDCSFSGEVYPFFKNSHKETTMRICSIGGDK